MHHQQAVFDANLYRLPRQLLCYKICHGCLQCYLYQYLLNVTYKCIELCDLFIHHTLFKCWMFQANDEWKDIQPVCKQVLLQRYMYTLAVLWNIMYEHKEINLISMKQHWTVYQWTMSMSIQQHVVHLCCLSKCQSSGRLIVANSLMPNAAESPHVVMNTVSPVFVKDQLYPVCQGPAVSCVSRTSCILCVKDQLYPVS